MSSSLIPGSKLSPITSASTSNVFADAPSDVLETANGKIERAVKKAFQYAERVNGTEDRAVLERSIRDACMEFTYADFEADRAVLERAIQADADSCQANMRELYVKGIFDAKNVESAAENCAKRIHELGVSGVANFSYYDTLKSKEDSQASDVRSAISSSSIDFSSMPSLSGALHSAAVVSTGVYAGYLAESRKADRIHIEALEKLNASSKTHHLKYRNLAGLNVATVNAGQNVKNLKIEAQLHPSTEVNEALESALKRRKDYSERRFKAALDGQRSRSRVTTAEIGVSTSKPKGIRLKGGLMGGLVMLGVEVARYLTSEESSSADPK